MKQEDFTFADFRSQMMQVARLGGTATHLTRRLRLPAISDSEMEAQVRRTRGVFGAMTQWERAHAEELHSSRRRRVARGAGVAITEVSQLIHQFEMIRDTTRGARSMSVPARLAAVLRLATRKEER